MNTRRTAAATSCPHDTEHKWDRALNRWVGFDPRVNEWGPCKAPALAQHARGK